MYSIENAKKSEIFKRIIVSSDDDEILQIALNCGVEALKRPAHLSDDYAGTREVITHAIDCLCATLESQAESQKNDLVKPKSENYQNATLNTFFNNSLCHSNPFYNHSSYHFNPPHFNHSPPLRHSEGFKLEESQAESQKGFQEVTSKDLALQANQLDLRNLWVCCLYATAPLLDFHALREAFKEAREKASDCYCFSAVEYDYSPYRAFTMSQGRNKMLFKEHFTKRSQDLEKVYHDAGQFYFALADIWRNRENIFEDSLSFLLPPSRVQDIDTIEDWNLAELKFKSLRL